MHADHYAEQGEGIADPPARDEAREMVLRGEREERLGHRALARSLYEQALRCRPATLEPEQVTDALCGVARTWQLDGDSDAALDCLEVAREVAARSSSPPPRDACSTSARWSSGSEATSMPPISLSRGASTRTKAGDARLRAMTAQNRGIIANVRGDLTRALGHYRECIAAYEQLGMSREFWGALNNLGMLHTDLGEWDEADTAIAAPPNSPSVRAIGRRTSS